MQRSLLFVLMTACLTAGGCLSTTNANDPRDAEVINRYADKVRARPQRDLSLRWPNGNGAVEEEKLVEITKIDARTDAFGKREVKAKVTIEISRWKTVDGKKTGQPEIRRETKERWLPAT